MVSYCMLGCIVLPFIALNISYPTVLCSIFDYFDICILEATKSILFFFYWFSLIVNFLAMGFIIFVNSLFQFNQRDFHWQNLGKLFSRECLPLLFPEAKGLLQPEGFSSGQKFLDHFPPHGIGILKLTTSHCSPFLWSQSLPLQLQFMLHWKCSLKISHSSGNTSNVSKCAFYAEYSCSMVAGFLKLLFNCNTRSRNPNDYSFLSSPI